MQFQSWKKFTKEKSRNTPSPLPPSSFGPEVFKTEECWGCEKTDLA